MLSALRKVLSFDFANRHGLDRAMSVMVCPRWLKYTRLLM